MPAVVLPECRGAGLVSRCLGRRERPPVSPAPRLHPHAVTRWSPDNPPGSPVPRSLAAPERTLYVMGVERQTILARMWDRQVVPLRVQETEYTFVRAESSTPEPPPQPPQPPPPGPQPAPPPDRETKVRGESSHASRRTEAHGESPDPSPPPPPPPPPDRDGTRTRGESAG